MSQGIFDTIIPSTTSGNQLATILNDFKGAVVSGFSGTSRPSQLEPGGYWIDTTDDLTGFWRFKIYDGVQDITVFTLNKNTGVASLASADSLFEIARISADSVGPILRLLKKRLATNGQTLTGDTVGELQFFGTQDNGVTTLQARVRAFSQNDVTALNKGSYLTFEASTLNSSSVIEVMRVIDAKVGIGVIAPTETLHVKGSGFRLEKETDDAVGSKITMKKKRITGVGQVVNNDTVGLVEFNSTDEAGGSVPAANIEVSARQDHTTLNQGSKIVIRNKKLNENTFTDQITIEDDVTIPTLNATNINVTNLVAANVELGGVVEIEDSTLILNEGGTQALADAATSGIEIDMSDATNAKFGYDSTKASKFVIGELGDLKEVADVSSAQNFTNKAIINPTRAGVKEDTEANLTTYAGSADNGQWCFATDTKVMYQIIDGELVPAGSGGGGTTLVWKKVGVISPVEASQDGIYLEAFDSGSTQEIYATLTVPSSYRAGKPIKLKYGSFFTAAITGNVLIKTQAALIGPTSVLGTYPNIRTSTNAQVAVSTTLNELNQIGDLDLTDATGQINGVAVAPGDKIRIRLYRDNANEISGAVVDALVMMENFEPTFS